VLRDRHCCGQLFLRASATSWDLALTSCASTGCVCIVDTFRGQYQATYLFVPHDPLLTACLRRNGRTPNAPNLNKKKEYLQEVNRCITSSIEGQH
jgi:hypothetical protein